MVVVYDPESGSATGGGWFWSGQGNLKNNPESEGKATFGFVVKYKNNVADGNLEFQYHVGDINLKSTDMTWLIVSSANANFQGEGTITARACIPSECWQRMAIKREVSLMNSPSGYGRVQIPKQTPFTKQ